MCISYKSYVSLLSIQRGISLQAAMDVWSSGKDASQPEEEEQEQWEAPESGKDALIVLVDVRPSMFLPSGGGVGGTWFQSVVDLLIQVTKSKVVANDNSLLSVAFFGSVRIRFLEW